MGKASSRMARTSAAALTLTGLVWMSSGVALASNGSPLAPASAARAGQAQIPRVTGDPRVDKLLSEISTGIPPGAGRFNTFGEDPLLTGQTGAGEISGIQSQGIFS